MIPARFCEISVTRKKGSARLTTAPASKPGSVGSSRPMSGPGGIVATWPRSSVRPIAATSTSSSA
jgi:hypothetical protein